MKEICEQWQKEMKAFRKFAQTIISLQTIAIIGLVGVKLYL